MDNKQANAPDKLQSLILSNQLTAVILFDAELRIQYLNSAAEVLFAVSQKSVLNHPAERLLFCPNESLIRHLDTAMASLQPITEREMQLPLASGAEITVDCTLVPVLNDAGQPGLMAELRQVDRQLRLSREEQLISQSYATHDLVRGLAHEIKNPLGGLRGAAQLLEQELENNELTEYTQVIIQEADRLQVLVDQMLGPRSLPVEEAINIHHILEHVSSVIGAEVGNKISITKDYDPSIPEIMGDKDQLIQGVMNIVKNAVQAVGDGGSVVLQTRIQRQMTLANVCHKLVAQINIIDDGPGVAAEIRERIFYPMVTSKAEGTGLGLSIAQTMLNRHGGLIEFSSKPGQTVFTLYLPLEQK